MENKFENKDLEILRNKMHKENVLKNIEHYNDEMTISQVVRFFERRGLAFTKTMIQNYVRVGLIPPPVDRRYYTNKHLVLLTIIDGLKDIYSLDEISTLFKPILKDTTTFDDDLLDINLVYNEYYKFYNYFVEETINQIPIINESINNISNEYVENEEDKNEANTFLLLMAIMTKSIVTKELTNILINNSK